MVQRVQHESRGLRPVAHGLAGDLRLWCVDLDEVSDALSDVQLIEPDRPRPARSPLSRESRRRLAIRLVLRSLLAERLGVSPAGLQLRATALGKPHLPGAGLHFSLSGSGPLGLIGVSRDLEVGVDVERVRPVPELHGLALNHLTERERDEWHATEPVDLSRRFLEVWTRKEACGKALGVGLLVPPARIEAGRAGGPRQVEIPVGGAICRATVCSVTVADDAVAAVAVTSPVDAARAVEELKHRAAR